MTASGDGELPAELLAAIADDPGAGRRQLPRLIGLLEADDPQTRLAAAWSCCSIANADPEAVPYLARRLGDRLAGDDVNLELAHTLEYLADRFPQAVETAFDELEAEQADAAARRDLTFPSFGNFTRNYYHDPSPGRSATGRIRLPRHAGDEDPRLAYTDEESDSREEGGDGADGESDDEDSDERATGPGSLLRRTTDVSTIAVRSRFDKLHVLGGFRTGRFSEDHDVLVGYGGEEVAIALRLLHLPEDTAARPAFEEAAGEHLRRWADIDDHPHLVSVLDWSTEPRPWIGTSFAGESLVEKDRFPPGQALEDALSLTDALAHCHRNDVVHAGIDAGNVAYPGEILEENDQEPPLLNNVGLLNLFRHHTNPARVLDPRYAAPEYYDSRFGTVDAMTDVYQLGGVIYRLFAGEPPVDGSFEAMKSTVTGSTTPVPGDVAPDVPDGVDEVVAKAMAREKLRRYETVEHLRQELASLREVEGL